MAGETLGVVTRTVAEEPPPHQGEERVRPSGSHVIFCAGRPRPAGPGWPTTLPGPHRLVVRTPPFQGGNTGSSPVGDTILSHASSALRSAGCPLPGRKSASFLRGPIQDPDNRPGRGPGG